MVEAWDTASDFISKLTALYGAVSNGRICWPAFSPRYGASFRNGKEFLMSCTYSIASDSFA